MTKTGRRPSGVRSVECLRCGAAPWQKCRSRYGYRLEVDYYHEVRKRTYASQQAFIDSIVLPDMIPDPGEPEPGKWDPTPSPEPLVARLGRRGGDDLTVILNPLCPRPRVACWLGCWFSWHPPLVSPQKDCQFCGMCNDPECEMRHK